MGTRLFLLLVLVPLTVSFLVTQQGDGSRDRRVKHAEHDKPMQKRSMDGVKRVEPPKEVYQQEASPLGAQNDSPPLYLLPHQQPPSSFPVVAKVVNEDEKTRDALEEVKNVANGMLTMHSYKGPQSLSQADPSGFGAKKNRASPQQEEECPYCPSGNCPYCRGKGGNNGQTAEEDQQESDGQCPNCPSGKCPWCHGKNKQAQQQQQEEEEEEGEQQCPNCPSGKCPWCHGKNQQNQPQNQGRCPNCPSGKCPWCHGKNKQAQQQQQEEEEYEDDEQGQQQCPNCPSGKCPWCHGKNNNQAAVAKPAGNSFSDHSNVQRGKGGQVAQNEEEEQGPCPNCPNGRCPWCGGALTKNGKCAGCPDGTCPWCHRNLQTGEGPDGSPPPCRDCPSGKCPWCHGKNQQQNTPTTYSAYNNNNNNNNNQAAAPNNQVEQQEEEEEGQQQPCPNCPNGRCPWCGGALTKNGKCAGCPDGTCPWCNRNLKTGEGPDGSPPPPAQGQCPNCPSGKCPWCHGKNQQQNADAPTQHQGYNNGQSGGCPYCPSGKCPWCHGKGQPPQQQPEVEYEYEEEPEEQTQAPPKKGGPAPQQQQQQPQQQWNQNQASAPTAQPAAHYGPPPGYQPQSPQSYANVQMPGGSKPGGGQPQNGQQQPEYEYEEEEEQPQQQHQHQQQVQPVQQQQLQLLQQPSSGQFGVSYGAIAPATGQISNYQAPGPAPTTPVKFRTGITSAVAPIGSLSSSSLQQPQHLQQSELPAGVTQGNGAGGCCVISLPPGRYQILPAAKAKARRKRSIENFRNRFLLRD